MNFSLVLSCRILVFSGVFRSLGVCCSVLLFASNVVSCLSSTVNLSNFASDFFCSDREVEFVAKIDYLE